jgi:translocation and assembly module TamA
MTGHRPVIATVVALLALLLSACAQLGAALKEVPRESPAAERSAYDLQIDAPAPLDKLLATYLDLARFQAAPETEAITEPELARLMAAAPAQVRSLLETEGYFNAAVHMRRFASPAGVTVIEVLVQPGPRTAVKEWHLDVQGGLQDAATAGAEDAQVELASLRRRWPLKAGEPFRQAAWTDAKNVTLARLRAEGYPAATWTDTIAHIDTGSNTAALQLLADSGPLFRLGPISIEGLDRYDEASVQRVSTFQPGMPYSEQLLLDYQERLLSIGLFEGASVEIDADPATHDAAPVRVRLKELPLQSATIGVGYSANVGPRLTLEHLHRRVFGQRFIARNKFELGPALKSWNGELTSHPLPGMYRNLVSANAERLRSADEWRTSWTARVGRAQDTPRIERLYYAEFTHSKLETAAGVVRSNAASLNFQWTWRRVDSLLLPTEGITLSLQTGAGYAFGRDFQDTGITSGRGPFSRLQGRVNWYQPFERLWFLTARAEAGQVYARQDVGVPDTLLFRAGGDESVRGYAFRTLGPTVNGVVTSGRVMATGSIEVAHPVSARRPQFLWATFFDAGQAADEWHDLHAVYGYGVGLRWRSPVGPLRVDLAYGEALRKVRLHMSVGVAF